MARYVWETKLLDMAKHRFEHPRTSTGMTAQEIDLEFGLPVGTGLLLYKHLVMSKQLPVMIGEKPNLNTSPMFIAG